MIKYFSPISNDDWKDFVAILKANNIRHKIYNIAPQTKNMAIAIKYPIVDFYEDSIDLLEGEIVVSISSPSVFCPSIRGATNKDEVFEFYNDGEGEGKNKMTNIIMYAEHSTKIAMFSKKLDLLNKKYFLKGFPHSSIFFIFKRYDVIRTVRVTDKSLYCDYMVGNLDKPDHTIIDFSSIE